jgi:hypothetical protein
MADETVFELTQENTMTAGMRFPLQETSSSTKATSATYALMGGLEWESSRDTNADHIDFTGTPGQIHAVDMSGAALTGEVIFDLPAEANVEVGERVGVYITAGSSTDGEELAIRTAATGDTIQGSATDYSSADYTRLFITGELMIFRCINKTTQADWIVEYDGRIPCTCRMTQSTAVTSSAADTFIPLDLDGTPTYDIGDIADTANGYMTVRRDGYFLVHVWRQGQNDSSKVSNYSFSAVYLNTTLVASAGAQHRNTSPNKYLRTGVATVVSASDGDDIIMNFYESGLDAGCVGGVMTAHEVFL